MGADLRGDALEAAALLRPETAQHRHSSVATGSELIATPATSVGYEPKSTAAVLVCFSPAEACINSTQCALQIQGDWSWPD
jgi:hypothetical protein